MRTFQFLAIISAVLFIFSSCISSTNASEDKRLDKYYNICLVLDGTDRLSEQNGVPCISSNEITDIARTIANNGVGCFYVTYVDNDCDNNRIAVFEWTANKPEILANKPLYMQVKEFEEITRASKERLDAYDTELENSILQFDKEARIICQSAYTDAIARQKNGSDVNGAINQAGRLLSASERGSSHIILVSDGCDNVGKELLGLSSSSELILVNTNVSKHHYRDIVSKECVTLKQAINHIFNL